MTRTICLLPILAALAACDVPVQTYGPDQCMRAELFQSCLKALPAGPQSTQYNDWDEVVKACEASSYYQSLRQLAHIKPECKSS